MAKKHRHAGRAVEVTSTLPADQLASLCKEAADGCQARVDYGKATIRLEQAVPGKLSFSVGRGGREFLAFEVKLSNRDGKQVMTSRILRYKTTQPTWGGLIPVAPKRMLGLNCYGQFMQRFAELVHTADPAAGVARTG